MMSIFFGCLYEIWSCGDYKLLIAEVEILFMLKKYRLLYLARFCGKLKLKSCIGLRSVISQIYILQLMLFLVCMLEIKSISFQLVSRFKFNITLIYLNLPFKFLSKIKHPHDALGLIQIYIFLLFFAAFFLVKVMSMTRLVCC